MKNTGWKFMRSHLLVGTSSLLSWEDFENKAGLKLRFKKKKCFSPQILSIKWWINKVNSPQYITSLKRFTSAFVFVRNFAFVLLTWGTITGQAFNMFQQIGFCFFLPNSNLYLFLSPEREVEGSASRGLSTEIHHHNRLGPSSVTTVKR